MHPCPETPTLDDTVEFSGHVWIQELPTGGEFRFQVAQSGLVTFATVDGSFESVTAVPVAFRRAAQLIDDELDLTALQSATEDPGTVTFCGVATRNEGVAYDWQSVPPFVGTDVWSGRQDQYLSPDTATGVFDRLGLPTLPAVVKERPAKHTEFTQYDDPANFPQSAWRDGKAAGLLIRDKAGGRAATWSVEGSERAPAAGGQSAAALAETYATTERIERTVDALGTSSVALGVDAIRDRLVADVARESYLDLYSDGAFVASLPAFQSAVAERVQRHQFDTE